MTDDLTKAGMTALVIALGIYLSSALIGPLMARLGITQALNSVSSGSSA